MRTKSKNTKIQNVEHAITLLALIITVIVLLILATVSISLIINSGILDHAQQGVDRYSEEEELEQIKLAVASASLKGNGFLTTDNLNSELQNRIDENEEAEKIGANWYYKGHIISENGNVEKYNSILPAEYQQVEYIESTGTQYILTRLTYEIDFEINCCFQLVELMDNYQTILGQDTYDARIDANGYFRGIEQLPYVGTTKHDCKMIANSNNNYRKIILDGETYIHNNTYKLKGQCAVFTNGSNIENRKSKARFFFGNVYLSNQLKRNFIPCYSTTTVTDVDGVERPKDTIGLYDTVEGKFYVNQGTGTFLKGADV